MTEASRKAFVLVHLTSSLGNNLESRLLAELWREMARKFGDIKFCEIKADMCIEGYPEHNTPTILIYRDGDIRKQVITLRELGGESTGIAGKHIEYTSQSKRSDMNYADLQFLLVSVGAVKASDHRVQRSKAISDSTVEGNLRCGKNSRAIDGDDDDWD